MISMELHPELDCANCTAHQQKLRGCHEKPLGIPMFLDNEALDRCIRRPVKDDPIFFNECISAYNLYQKNLLPNMGCFNEQPIGFGQIINLIEKTIGECNNTKEESKKQKQRNARRSGLNRT